MSIKNYRREQSASTIGEKCLRYIYENYTILF